MWVQLVCVCVCREGRHYLPWLLARFRGLGGAVKARRVGALSELAAYNAVINCTGGSVFFVGWGMGVC